MNLITVLFGLYSVKNVNIPLFLTFRRCAIIFTIMVQYITQGTIPSGIQQLCTALMLSGALTAGWDTIDSGLFGYLLVMGNNLSQSMYNVAASTQKPEQKLSAFELNFYFASIGLPLMYVITNYQGEFHLISEALNGDNFDLKANIFISGISGILITMFNLLTVMVVGPLAINIGGIIKDVLLTYLGFILFSDANLTAKVALGLLMSFTGAIIFTHDKVTAA